MRERARERGSESESLAARAKSQREREAERLERKQEQERGRSLQGQCGGGIELRTMRSNAAAALRLQLPFETKQEEFIGGSLNPVRIANPFRLTHESMNQ